MESRNPAFSSHRAGLLRLLRFVLIFAVSFVVLHRAYITVRERTNNALSRQLNAVVTAAIINTVTPSEAASVEGTSLKGRGVTVDIVKGCEGFEIMLLLVAALLAYPMAWKRRLPGMLAGCLFVYLLNLLRLVSLFYVARYQRDLFDAIHLSLWQSILIILATLFFVFWIRPVPASGHTMRYQQPPSPPTGSRTDAHPRSKKP